MLGLKEGWSIWRYPPRVLSYLRPYPKLVACCWCSRFSWASRWRSSRTASPSSGIAGTGSPAGSASYESIYELCPRLPALLLAALLLATIVGLRTLREFGGAVNFFPPSVAQKVER
jgi:hypothetical protein